jgi:hypothetical protein
MKITFAKKLKDHYIFNAAATDVQIENVGEEAWSKLQAIFDNLKEFKRDDDTRKAGYGVLKSTAGEDLSFRTDDTDEQMPRSVKQALIATKKAVLDLPPTLLDDAPLIRTIIDAAWDILPLRKESDCYLTIGLLRYGQNHKGLGPHKDGAKYVTTHLITRKDIEGAQSTFYENGNDDSLITEITMARQLDSLAFADREIYHGVKPITITRPQGHRDIIVLGFHPEL